MSTASKRKLLIPEVVQTSSLDCGPAALKSLLEGFGRHISYGRLREACQTGLDGTSLDTIEDVANQFGLEAEQIMLPLDHLLLTESHALPAIVVVTLNQQLTHFVVVWHRVGDWLQVMDPNVGRRWVRSKTFLKDVYQHTMTTAARDWFDYASSADFQRVYKARQRALRVDLESSQVNSWRQLAARDAALRLTQSLVDSGGVSRGRLAQHMVERFAQQPELIPRAYWSAVEAELDEHGNEQISLRGAILMRVKSASSAINPAINPDLTEELAAALSEKHGSPMREIGRLLLKSGRLVWLILLIALIAASGGIVVEALLFRGLLDVNSTLPLTGQRMVAGFAIAVFCFALLLLDLSAFAAGARLGRILETRLRVMVLEKLPKMSDSYFHSRLISDMAERSHILHRLRHLPDQLRQLTLAGFQLIMTAAGVVWLEPKAWPIALASVGAALIPLFSSHWLLAERDLRVRTHAGGLMRFYLDAMLGLMPIRAHGAAASLSRQHNALLQEWTAAGFRLQRVVVGTEGLQLFIMFGLVAALLLLHPLAGVQVGRVLLMAYWALNMPALGQEIAIISRQYPNYRSIALRLLEPLNAPEEESSSAGTALLKSPVIEFRNVHVVASGNPILTDISATIEAGSHVAIVGSSGAGKSTLVGLLLGWLKPYRGEILVDGKPLDVEQFRRSATWVDPAVQIWNRSLQSNLSYGGDAEVDFGQVIDAAALRPVLETLPLGLQTVLGENGGLVSGGEGQRVRLGRALQRRNAKIVILDEPFRGLDRERRRELLARARQYWSGATMLCVTHDLLETFDFDQILVIEGGAVIESGSPKELARNSESRYVCLLAADEQARTKVWESENWRRVQLHSGRLLEQISRPTNVETLERGVA